MRKEEDELDDVEEYEYFCFDTRERYPDGCKDRDQVMHEGVSRPDPGKPKGKKE